MILIDYIGKKQDGEIFDLTIEDKAREEGLYNDDVDYSPIPVLVGHGYVIDGLDEELQDMDIDEERELEIPSEKAYGGRDSEKIQTYPEKEFKKQNIQVRPGEELMIGNQRGKVISNSSGRVRIDFNHPLSGKDLDYWVEVVEEVEDDEEIVEKIIEFRIGHGDAEFDEETVKVVHEHGEDHEHKLPEEVKDDIEEEILEATSYEKVEFKE